MGDNQTSEHDIGPGTCSRCLFWDSRRNPDGDIDFDPCKWSDGKFADGFEQAGFCKLASNGVIGARISGDWSELVRARAYGHEDYEAGLLTRPDFGCLCFRDAETGDDPPTGVRIHG